MSTANFHHADRIFANSTDDRANRLRFMVRSGGFVMCRLPREKPMVLSEKEWNRLPLWEPAQ